MPLARLIVALAVVGFAIPAEAAGVQCRELPSLFRVYTQQHYTVKRVDEVVQRQTAERFIEYLDPSRTLLLASEVDSLRAELPQLFAEARDGDCRLLDQAWELVMRRSAEDRRIATELLTPTFELDESVTLALDPDERDYPRSAAERTARVRDMMHFQISSYLVAGLTLEKAKSQLLHRFELIEKRLSERRADGELTWLWAQAFAEALDPHTGYMSPDDLADFEIALRLSLEGIGAVLSTDDGFTVIQSLVPGGGADKSQRLRPRDKIIAVAQEGEPPVSAIDMDLTDVVKMIRGKKGTKVTLTVLRESKSTKTFNVTIVRDKIDVASQAAKITYETRRQSGRAYKLGIIDLPSFYGGEKGGRSSYADMKKLLAEARAQKVDGIVLDLSRNGGGLLDEAVRISGLFIKQGPVVGTKSTDGKLAILEDTDTDVDWAGPLVVLTSRASASASEILAGALRDYHRALVVGADQTFGKGTVQVVIPMPSEVGAIRVTTGMFFLPAGRSTQLEGVPSDIRIPTIFDGYDIGEDELDYAMPAQAVSPFTSDVANSVMPDERWAPLTPELVSGLVARSKARIAKEPGFAELREQVAEIERNKGLVRLAELRQRALQEEKGKDGGDEDEDESRFDASQKVVVGEAVSILVDAISAGWRSPGLAPGQSTAGPTRSEEKLRKGVRAHQPGGGGH